MAEQKQDGTVVQVDIVQASLDDPNPAEQPGLWNDNTCTYDNMPSRESRKEGRAKRGL